ncbi:MAG TPA: ABC transporter ATP-binding protein [Bacillota bacterium]|nr:ABC transporter ATP-binding protein [Bacillota bacterium]
MSLVQINNLHKSYGTVEALHGLTMSIDEGQIYGFVGPDGAGKTSLLRMLCGILLPTAGTIDVLGIDVCRKPEEVKPMIGYMAQKFSLYGTLTIWENLMFFAELFGTPRKDIKPLAEKLLNFAGIWKFRERQAQNLSGGMKQKLALCCTMIHRPRLLILDEPTTGVDPVSRHEFWEMLKPLPQEGTSVIVSTGYMDEAERCDRIALFHEGNLLVEETTENILLTIQSKLVEVRCDSLRDARSCLTKLADVYDVEVFGDRLHVFYRGQNLPAFMAGIPDRLRSSGIAVNQVQEIAPHLEDVFMERVGRKGAKVS